jgi:hypothetical protein
VNVAELDRLDAGRLAAVLVRTLEDAAFVLAQAAESGAEGGVFEGFGGEVLEARLGWTGCEAGELRLAVSPELAASLAANLLGVDEAPGRGEDALGEIVNMATGALVAELFGDADPPRLGLPRVARLSVADHAAERRDAAVAVALVEEEGRRIEARVVHRAGRQP